MHPMSKTKYNWADLKRDFLASNFAEVKGFLRDKNVPYNSRTRANTKGWLEEKERYQGEINQGALERFKEEKSDLLAEGLKTVTEVILKELKTYQSASTALDPRKLYMLWKILRIESGLFTDLTYRESKSNQDMQVDEEKIFNDLMGDYERSIAEQS